SPTLQPSVVQAGTPASYYRTMRRPATYSLWILAITLSVAAARERPMAFSVTSTAFKEGAGIPVKHTCDGADVSPPLAWSGAPAGPATRYLFRRYGLDTAQRPRPGAAKQAVEAAMKGHILATAQLMGTYARQRR